MRNSWRLRRIIGRRREAADRNGPGFRVQLLLFLDDLMPSLFDKPLMTRAAPENRQIAW